MFKPGDKKPEGSGRKAGTPNKNTAAIKEMIEAALEAEGGVDYLRGVAKSDPQAFCGLIKSILPKDINIGATEGLTEILEELFGKGKS
jgi:hypothetical protein